MGTIFFLVAVLLAPTLARVLLNRLAGRSVIEAKAAGRAGLSLVFLITGLAHFVQTEAMALMIPPWVPGRIPLVYATGVLELAAAAGLQISRLVRTTGICLLLFLVLVFPANIYSAVQQVNFGGHAMGPVYLLARAPLQVVLFGWTWWFAVRRTR